MKFRHAYSADQAEVSYESGLACDYQLGRTKQSFKEECDINTIVRRFGLTGKVPVGFKMPQTGDFTNVSDFQSAMNLIVEAEDSFLQVPAEIRARFDHNPQALMSFMENPANVEECRRLGLFLTPDVPRETVDVERK